MHHLYLSHCSSTKHGWATRPPPYHAETVETGALFPWRQTVPGVQMNRRQRAAPSHNIEAHSRCQQRPAYGQMNAQRIYKHSKYAPSSRAPTHYSAPCSGVLRVGQVACRGHRLPLCVARLQPPASTNCSVTDTATVRYTSSTFLTACRTHTRLQVAGNRRQRTLVPGFRRTRPVLPVGSAYPHTRPRFTHQHTCHILVLQIAILSHHSQRTLIVLQPHPTQHHHIHIYMLSAATPALTFSPQHRSTVTPTSPRPPGPPAPPACHAPPP